MHSIHTEIQMLKLEYISSILFMMGLIAGNWVFGSRLLEHATAWINQSVMMQCFIFISFHRVDRRGSLSTGEEKVTFNLQWFQRFDSIL